MKSKQSNGNNIKTVLSEKKNGYENIGEVRDDLSVILANTSRLKGKGKGFSLSDNDILQIEMFLKQVVLCLEQQITKTSTVENELYLTKEQLKKETIESSNLQSMIGRAFCLFSPDRKTSSRDSLETKIKQLILDKGELEHRLKSAEADRDRFMTERNEYRKDRAKFISLVGEKERDKTKTVDLASEKPRNDKVAEEYRYHKTQHYTPTINSIFNILRKTSPLSSSERAEKTIKMKAILSHRILCDGHHLLLNSSQSKREQIAEVSQKVFDSVSEFLRVDTENFVKEKLLHSVTEEVERLVTSLKDEDNRDEPFCLKDAEPDFTNKVKESIYNELCTTFDLQLSQIKSDSADEGIEEELEELLTSSLDLLRKATLADPPGRFVSYEKGFSFKEAMHQDAHAGKSGEIKFTVFPAYIVKDKVYERANVILSSGEKSPK